MGSQINFGKQTSVSLTDTYRQTLTDATNNSMSYSFDTAYTVHCTGPAAGGLSLWQQVTEDTDGKFRVWGTETVCRYGENKDVEPECPFEACLDD